MSIPHYRLLALDLDGTVLNDEKHISPTTRKAIEDAIAAGVTVVPASGRPFHGLCPEFLTIPGVAYAITSNGASINRVSDGKLIHSDTIDDETALSLMTQFLSLSLVASFFHNGQGYAVARQHAFIKQLSVPAPVIDFLLSTRIVLDDAISFVRDHGKIEKITLNFPHLPDGTRSDYDRAREILSAYPQLSVVSGGHDNLEITSPSADKGNALLTLANLLGIPHSETMACGDSENDLAMLKAAGLSVGMANCESCVRDVVDKLTDSNEHDGVAKAIYKFILTE